MIFDPQHSVQKFNKIIEFINTYRIVSFHPATGAKICRKARQIFSPPSTSLPEAEWEEFDAMKPLDFGITKDDWFAFQGEINFPRQEFENNEFLTKITFSINKNYLVRAWDDDSPSGPEGRCWLNNKPLTSLDGFHDGTFYIQNESTEKVDSNHFESIIFTAHCSSHHTLSKFGVTVFHRDTELLFRILKVLMNLINEIENKKSSNLQCENDRYKLIDAIDKALRLLDIRDSSYPIKLNQIRIHDSSKKSFYSSAKNCLESLFVNLEKNFASKTINQKNYSVNVIAYSHLDSCWLWPFTLSKSKIVNTMTNTLNLLNFPSNLFTKSGNKVIDFYYKKLSEESQWKFLFTAPQHLEWIKKNDFELFEKILNQKNDRIFIDGAMWVESDTTLSSGETLVRQFMFSMNEYKKDNKVLFLPDCFGFSASLPQLMKLSGVVGFVTSKITWSEYTKFPYSTFKWRGIDGTEIIAHFISNPNDAKPGTTKYVGTNTAHEIIRTFDDYKQKDILPNSSLCLMGRGDGGGGVDEEMIWNLRILSLLTNSSINIESLPKINFPNLNELFQSIQEKEEFLNVWDDELYLERHQGTLTSQEEVKRMCKLYESHLHSIEWIIVVLESVVDHFKFNINQFSELSLDDFWKQSLLFHFHDSVTGTSTNQANFELLSIGYSSISKFEEIELSLLNLLQNLINKKLNKKESNQSICFNTLCYDREINTGLFVPSGGWKIIDSNSVLIENYKTDFYERINVDDSFKVHHFTVNEMKANDQLESYSKASFDSNNFTVTTESLVVKFNQSNGRIKSVKERKTNREFLSSEGNKFVFYEDRSVAYPAWDIQLYHKEMQLKSPKLLSFAFNGTTYFNRNENASNYINKESQEDQNNNNNSNNNDDDDNDFINNEFRDENVVTLEYSIDDLSHSKIIQKIEFNNSQLTFSTRVNWLEHDKLLKVSFPTNIRNRSALFGIQFGYIERPTHRNTTRDLAKYEVSGRWADLSDSTGGVTICSDVKSGYDVHEGEMMLSLLKAPLQTDKWCDFGWRKFTYKVDFHAEPFDATRATKMSDELNYPIVSTIPNNCSYKPPVKLSLENLKFNEFVENSGCSFIEGKFVKIEDEFSMENNSPGVILETIKPSNNGNGFVARLYEVKGGSRKAKIAFPLLQEKKWKVNFIDFHEKIISNEEIKANNTDYLEFSIDFKPFQIISLQISLCQ